MRAAAILAFHICLAIASGPASAGEGWGSLKGQIVVRGALSLPAPRLSRTDSGAKDSAICAAQAIPDESLVVDPETKGLANVFVYLKGRVPEVHPDLRPTPTKPVEMRVQNCRYYPHLFIARTDQHVEWWSERGEPVHNIHPYALNNAGISSVPNPHSSSEQSTPALTHRFPNPESLPTAFRCDIHPWMLCYGLILDHPYAAISDRFGRFEIANLPAGEQTFRVWHERKGWLRRDWNLTIESGRIFEAPEIEVAAEALELTPRVSSANRAEFLSGGTGS